MTGRVAVRRKLGDCADRAELGEAALQLGLGGRVSGVGGLDGVKPTRVLAGIWC